jgi:glycosyltransferase involved in cell wall biosynthesis
MNSDHPPSVLASGNPEADTPVISVIMPNFNGAQLIARSIDSVLSQTFHDLELIIVDDGSSDESLAVVKDTPDKRIRLLQQDHEGVCAARNRGIGCARGQYIAFLDSDDTWAPTCLERLHEAILYTPDAAIAYCGWQNIGLGGERDKPFIPPDYETPDKLELWIRNSRWPIHAALTKKAAILEAGGFDPRYPTSEDFLLWLQIVGGNKIVRVPEVLAFYYHHEGPRATRDRVRMALNHHKAQGNFLQKHPDIRKTLGWHKVRSLTAGELLVRGYECYWQGDLESARTIFRHVMKTGYGGANDWKRMLPALLPLALHRRLIRERLAPKVAAKENVQDQE